MNLVPFSPSSTVPDVMGRVSSLLEDFLGGLSEKTRAAYDSDLRRFAEHLGSSSSREAIFSLLSRGRGEAALEALRWRTAMTEKGLAPSTVNRRLSALRSVVDLARTAGLIDWRLEVKGRKVESYRDTRGPGRGPVLEALSRVKMKASTSDKGRRDYALLRLFIDLALRRSEISALDLSDVEAGRIHILGKGREEKEPLTLPELTRAALEEWISVRGPEPGPLFTSFDRARKGDGRLTPDGLHALAQGWGLEHPHAIRHTSITEAALLSGGNMPMVMRFARHKDARTTVRYIDNQKDLGGEAAVMLSASFPG